MGKTYLLLVLVLNLGGVVHSTRRSLTLGSQLMPFVMVTSLAAVPISWVIFTMITMLDWMGNLQIPSTVVRWIKLAVFAQMRLTSTNWWNKWTTKQADWQSDKQIGRQMTEQTNKWICSTLSPLFWGFSSQYPLKAVIPSLWEVSLLVRWLLTVDVALYGVTLIEMNDQPRDGSMANLANGQDWKQW